MYTQVLDYVAPGTRSFPRTGVSKIRGSEGECTGMGPKAAKRDPVKIIFLHKFCRNGSISTVFRQIFLRMSSY